VIRDEILPLARQFNIVLGVENVWNGFLLSPLEFVRYTDSFDSPLVRPYLDVGNIIFGRPEDWIEIAGRRIIKLHLKDFRLDRLRSQFAFRKIGEGHIDWAKVRKALDAVGFAGWGTFAEAQFVEGPIAGRIYRKVANPPTALRAVPGSGRSLAVAYRFLARRLLKNVMQRYERHVA
jgi:sugar phosphate isomerase/epimerase